ncbi:MAG: type II secretion system F family protein [Patescibacteria group bacterium]
MKFSYNARTKQGEIKQGEMDMPSEEALANYLAQQDLILTQTKALNHQVNRNWLKIILNWQPIRAVDKIFFTQNLQVMLKAGLTVTAALKTLAEQTSNKRFKNILKEIKTNVEKGLNLSDSLRHYPKVFSELFINMVSVGEKSGKLEEVLLQITNQLRKNHTLVSKIKGALTYPIIVIITMIGIGIAMIVFVIPQITSIFTEVSASLPLPTRILIAFSNFIATYGLWVGIGLIILIVAFMYIIRTKGGKKVWHSSLLNLPLIGRVFKQINLAKFSRTFSSLLKTDIPIIQTFQITSTTLGNVRYRLALIEAAEKVKAGMGVSQSLLPHHKLFPPLVIQMLAVGEETGTLDTVLEDLASFYEEEVDRIMSNLSTIIEPILMVILGGAVGFFAVSIIMPMYSLSEAI